MKVHKAKYGKKFTYETLAKEVGVAKSTLDAIATRDQYNTTIGTLDKICRALKTTPFDILVYDPSKPQERPKETGGSSKETEGSSEQTEGSSEQTGGSSEETRGSSVKPDGQENETSDTVNEAQGPPSLSDSESEQGGEGKRAPEDCAEETE